MAKMNVTKTAPTRTMEITKAPTAPPDPKRFCRSCRVSDDIPMDAVNVMCSLRRSDPVEVLAIAEETCWREAR